MEGLEQLCEVIERNRQVAEDDARLAPEVREAAGRAGLWMLAAPKEVGGLELSLPELAKVFATVAEADPTVAWHASNSLALGTAAAELDEDVRRAVIGDGQQPFAFSGVFTEARARPVDAGYRVEGCWPFMTGASDAAWALVSATVDAGAPADGPPWVRRFVVPLDALEVGENWRDASAMRGTGSHAVATPPGGLLVPAGRHLSLKVTPRIERPLYRLPGGQVFLGTLAPVCLGALRSATRGTIELSRTKVSRFDGHAHGEQVRVQQAIADSAAEHDCLTAGFRAIVEEIWATAEAGEAVPQDLRARFWSTIFLTVDRCREQASRLYAVATSAAYATANPVERALRDIHAVSATTESFQNLRWDAARVMLGQEPRHPAF